MILDGFFLKIDEILLAHAFTLDRAHRCAYPNGRGSYGIVLALEGMAEFRFSSGEQVVLTEGCALFLSPDAAYTVRTEGAFRHYTVNFRAESDGARLGALDGKHTLLPCGDTEGIRHAFRRLVAIFSAKGTGFEMQSFGTLYELLALFYSTLDASVQGDAARLQPAREYIEHSFRLPITLSELAARTGMSVTHFRRVWQRQYGTSPMRYRDSIRLSFAKEYLHSGYYTVAEVAEKCGFDDPNYFVRFFKRHVGIPPRVYQKQYL